MASDPSRALPQSLLRNDSDFPEMQRKWSFSTKRSSLSASSNREAEAKSLPTSNHLHLMWHKDTRNKLQSFHTILCEGTSHLKWGRQHSPLCSILYAGLPQAKQLIKLASTNITSNTARHWNTHLSSLSVQCQLTEAINLDQESQVWKRTRDSLYLSYILSAASDTLPIPWTNVTGRFSVVPNVLCVEIPDQQWHLSKAVTPGAMTVFCPPLSLL